MIFAPGFDFDLKGGADLNRVLHFKMADGFFAMAMNAIAELLNEPESNASLKKEVQENREIVAKRASIFLQEAKEEGLNPYPYRSGFFVTLKVKDAYATCLALKAKRIFLAPVKDNAVRIALCSLPSDKIPGLAHAIKECSHD